MTAPVLMRRVLFLIPARSGSRGIPDKNLQQVDGASLVARAAICAHRFLRELPLPDSRVVVDTDSEAIAAEAREWHAEVPFLRPTELAGDRTTTAESTIHLLDRLAADGWRPDTIVLLQPTSPLRRWTDLLACWEQMAESGAESVISVVEPSKPPQLAMELGDGGVLSWLRDASPPAPGSRRQDLVPAFAPSGAVYITSAVALRERGAFVVPGVTVGVRCDVPSSLDVDTPHDLLTARRIAPLAESPPTSGIAVLPGRPRKGTTVTLSGMEGSIPVAGARTLPGLMVEWKRHVGVSGVLVLPEPATPGPGPAVWREALGCPVAFWCESVADAASLALVLGAADIVVVPESSPEVGELVRGLLRATEHLRDRTAASVSR